MPEIVAIHAKLCPDFSFYLHVDKKADQGAFAGLARLPNVSFVEKRHQIFWGGWNMVLAELELMKAALAAGADRLILVSDDTIPIQPQAALEKAVRPDICHLGLWDMPPSDPAHVRYTGFYFFDSWATGQRSHDIYRRTWSFHETQKAMELHALKRRGKARVDRLFKGPQWWCLTGTVAAEVLAHHERDEHFRTSFEFSLISDEHYIQTIIGNINPPVARLPYPIWTDVSRNPAPWKYDRLDELGEAIASGKLYCRKVTANLAHQMLQASGLEET